MNKHSIVFSALMACTHACWATPVVDQTSGLIDPSGPTLFSGFVGTITAAQTFTVGVTGLLVQLIVNGYNRGGEMMVDIRGQSGGHPDNANVLQTVRVGNFNGLTAIDLSLAVTAGDPLSFVFYGGSGGLTGLFYGPDHDTYASGGLWIDGHPPFGEDGPGTWYPNGNQGIPLDLSFATLVDEGTVPEPTSSALIGIGLATLIALHRRTSPKGFALS